MEDSSVSEIFDSAFHFFSHNSSYAIPGLYDLEVEDTTWVLASAVTFFTMQTGIALIEAGVVKKKNQVNVFMKSMVDVCAGGLSFWMFGFALMYGRGEFTNPFFGAGDFFVNTDVNDPLTGQVFSLYFIQMSFATKATSLVSGAVAERFKFTAYILFSFLSTFVYAVGAGWIWGQHGWLRNIGVVDFAGSGPIHIIGGAAAFAAAWFIGPRIGRYKNGTEPLPMGQPLLVCLGLFIVWWGWIGFNAGSSYGITGGKWELAARAGAGTTLASMAAGMASILFSLMKHKGKADVGEVIAGVLSGLVAINSGCFMFSMYSAVATGAIAAILCLLALPIVDKMGVDDAVGATAVHLVCGVWGQLSVGFFADAPTGPKGIFLGGGTFQLVIQAISAICLTVWASTVTIVILWIVNKIIKIRLNPDDELEGCDITQHNLCETCANANLNTFSTLDRIVKVSAPKSQRFEDPADPKYQNEFTDYDRRRVYHSNLAFDRDETF